MAPPVGIGEAIFVLPPPEPGKTVQVLVLIVLVGGPSLRDWPADWFLEDPDRAAVLPLPEPLQPLL